MNDELKQRLISALENSIDNTNELLSNYLPHESSLDRYKRYCDAYRAEIAELNALIQKLRE